MYTYTTYYIIHEFYVYLECALHICSDTHVSRYTHMVINQSVHIVIYVNNLLICSF